MRFFITSLLVLFCCVNPILSQEIIQKPRIALFLNVGVNLGFNSFMQEEPSNTDFFETRKAGDFTGIGLMVFHKKEWISSYSFNNSGTNYGVAIHQKSNGNNSTSSLYQASISSLSYENITLQIGKLIFLDDPRWQLNWLVGTSLEFVVGRSSGSVDYKDSKDFALYSGKPILSKGIAPSLQAGYQITFRGKRMGVSLKAIGNLGLRYYASKKYEAWLNNERYFATVSTKGDFIAAMLQYEVYFGKRK